MGAASRPRRLRRLKTPVSIGHFLVRAKASPERTGRDSLRRRRRFRRTGISPRQRPFGGGARMVGEDGRMFEMSCEEFEAAVSDALDEVPEEFARQLENVVVLIEDDAPPDDPTLLGYYDGIPLTERGHWSGGQLPDRILIFRNPTLEICDTREDVVEEVTITVVHEIAHFFGIDDAKLHELGWA